MRYRIMRKGGQYKVMIREGFFIGWRTLQSDDGFDTTQDRIFTTEQAALNAVANHEVYLNERPETWEVIKELTL